MRKATLAAAIRTAAVSIFLIVGHGSIAYAIDPYPHYVPRPQTDSERLQNFRPPPPPPKQDTLLDRAARAYDSAPIRPYYDATTKAPVIQYQRKW